MNSIDFLSKEYNEKSWIEYASICNDNRCIVDGIPQDIVNVVLDVLGNEMGYDWLQRPISVFEGKTVKELIQTSNGEKALKAFIMRLPV